MKDVTKLAMIFSVVLVAVLAFTIGPFSVTQQTPSTTLPQKGCAVEDVSVDVSPVDAETGSTVDLCTIIERKQGDDWIRVTDEAATGSSDISASPYQNFRIWTVDDTDGDFSCDGSPGVTGDYYADYKEFEVGCESIWTVKTKSYREGGLTLTGYYKYSEISDASSSTNMTVTAGSTETVDIDAKSVSDRQFGQSADDTGFTELDYSTVWCLDYNNSQKDVVELREDGTSNEYPTASEPDQHSTPSNYDTDCWAVSDNFRDGATEKLDLYIDFDDSNVPSTGETWDMTVYDVGLYEDANDKNAVKFGVEDEDGNDVGNSAAATMSIYFGTGT